MDKRTEISYPGVGSVFVLDSVVQHYLNKGWSLGPEGPVVEETPLLDEPELGQVDDPKEI